MSRQRTLLAAIATASAAACATPPAPKRAESPPEGLLPERSRCLQLYETRGGSSIGKHPEPNFSDTSTYVAVSFHEFQGAPVPGIEKYAVAGQALMRWHASSPVVVDKAHFDDLAVTNPAEYRESSAPLLIGHVSREAFQALGGRGLFDFLLHGQVIRPYVHLGRM